MTTGEFQSYNDIIEQKLKTTKRKLELSLYKSQHTTDSEKTLSIGKDLITIRELLNKLEKNELNWEDINSVGISKESILEAYSDDKNHTHFQNISDFSLLSGIPMVLLSCDTRIIFLDELYSIIEYINQHYQIIFTQKVFLLSSKTSTIREKFYIMYQDIARIFKNYGYLLDLKNKTTDTHALINKEHIALVKKINIFFYSIKEYLELIKSDSTFTYDDLNTLVKSAKHSSIVEGLSLDTALSEFLHYITEAIAYLQIKERDLFDTMSLEKNN